MSALLPGASRHRGLAHLLDEIVRAAIGAEPHRHAGPQIVAEILHDLAIASEWRRAMRHRRPAVAKDREVGSGPAADPRVMVEEEGVSEDRAGAEEADSLRPLHRGLAVAADHLAYFADALGDMQGEGEAALARCGAAVPQKSLGAGV